MLEMTYKYRTKNQLWPWNYAKEKVRYNISRKQRATGRTDRIP